MRLDMRSRRFSAGGATVVAMVFATATAIVGYLFLSHWLTLNAADQPWAIAALLGPIWLICAVTALRKRSVVAFALLALAAVVIAVVVARGGIGDVHRLYLIEHVGIHIALCISFASTLRQGNGRVSLIESVASRVHGSLTPDMAAYARKVTITWVAYFMCMAATSVAVFQFAGWGAWALLANVVTPAALVLLFVGEHVVRYWLHPEFERATLLDTVRAYRRPA